MSRQDTIGTHKTLMYVDSEGNTCVKYHKTDVVKRDAHGRITLESGGWRTVTTKARMNQALRQWAGDPEQFYYVHQVKGDWFVGRYKGNGVHERVCEYYDGVTLQ
jgi:hypothetical protein